MNNKSNTQEGSNVEHLFANSIQDHSSTFNAIKLSLDISQSAKVKSIDVVGDRKRKADVEIIFENDKIPPIRVNIKSFKGVGYNHIERRRLDEFCKRNQISKSDTDFLIELWLRKARSNNSHRKLVDDSERDRVRKIFSGIEPAASALLGNDHPQILALFNVLESKWHIYNLNKQVLPLIRQCTVGFTSKSANITIGEYIVIQRKGSSRGESGSDPFTITHGSNNAQIKMRVKNFFYKVKPIAWYQL